MFDLTVGFGSFLQELIFGAVYFLRDLSVNMWEIGSLVASWTIDFAQVTICLVMLVWGLMMLIDIANNKGCSLGVIFAPIFILIVCSLAYNMDAVVLKEKVESFFIVAPVIFCCFLALASGS